MIEKSLLLNWSTLPLACLISNSYGLSCSISNKSRHAIFCPWKLRMGIQRYQPNIVWRNFTNFSAPIDDFMSSAKSMLYVTPNLKECLETCLITKLIPCIETHVKCILIHTLTITKCYSFEDDTNRYTSLIQIIYTYAIYKCIIPNTLRYIIYTKYNWYKIV